jgi:hypothetical protein
MSEEHERDLIYQRADAARVGLKAMDRVERAARIRRVRWLVTLFVLAFVLPSAVYQLAWYWFSETHECTRWQRFDQPHPPLAYSACVEWKRR